MTKPKTGRPRSEKSREATLDAAQALLRETGGAGLSMEAIARRAGVGKPTLYRWWPSLADIVLEALLRRADAEISAPRDPDPVTALREFLRQSMRAIAGGGGAHLRFLMAQAQQDEGFRQRFRDNFVARRRAVLRSILARTAECGECRPGPSRNPDLLVDMIFGAMWYRLLTGHASLDQAFADELTDMATEMAGVGQIGTTHSPRPSRRGA